MCTRSCSFIIIASKLLFIFINSFMIECAGKNYLVSRFDYDYCPFIETLSFGSDIDVKCNSSYLTFNEVTVSMNRRCVYSTIRILENTGHKIIFTVDDVAIHRIEFIIRRCNGFCRNYDTCSEEDFIKDATSNNFRIPDSIEKLSCDFDCLNDVFVTGLTSATLVSPLFLSSTQESLNLALSIKRIIILYSLSTNYNLGKKHVYSKTINVDPDECK
ncbi:unnamed protein product [Rotaria magnacalcarata]|uniref:Uncharacterized protein n=1 Tax=Rotaria magnacalcarata TaxID=392030 RepID=A0A8S2J5Q3_9BILA|nr:unnamed protein product [Rotaria magnacalcarata]